MRSDPDPGIHSAAEWALRQWDIDGQARKKRQARVPRGDAPDGRVWYVTRNGHTMAILAGNPSRSRWAPRQQEEGP